MSLRHFCTYFDHNYLPRGMVMLESLHEHCPDAHVHVLCLSDECHTALSALAYPFVCLIPLRELEAADPELAATRPTRTLIEYYFTITPCLPWYLLTAQGLEEITYLDADMMFFFSPEPIFAEAERGSETASVILTPHRFSPGLEDLRKYGLYNVSWMTFSNTPTGLACLGWYRHACLDWCRDILDADRFADQKYLDVFPSSFEGVHTMRASGGGVAPWNVGGSRLAREGGQYTVNGEPLIFYHAQGFTPLTGRLYASGLLEYRAGPPDGLLRDLLRMYARKYADAARRASALTLLRDFSGIRFGVRGAFFGLRMAKRIIKEFMHGTLVWP